MTQDPAFELEDDGDQLALLDEFVRNLLDGEDTAALLEQLREPWRAEALELVACYSSAGGGPDQREITLHTEARFTLERYTLLDQIGWGGQGSVFRAHDNRLNRRVAVKLLHAPLGLSARTRARFLREAEVASRLSHPGICAVHDFGERDGVPYIVMELVSGTSLAQRIADSQDLHGESGVTTRAEVDALLALVEGVARALHTAHAHGLVHRDVKPANIMITDDERPVLCDFGLAHDDDQDGPELTATGELLGTPAYMAPEQVKPDGTIDRRVDVYALGVTLYEVLTGRRPFATPTRAELYDAILAGSPLDARRLNPSIPRDLAVVVATAMERDPKRRYATTLELAEELRRVREREPILARPAGPVLRGGRWVQRNPVLATAVALIVVALASIWGLAAFKDRQIEATDVELTVLADARSLENANRRAAELWPARPETVKALEAWLRDHGRLGDRLEAHRALRDELRGAAAEAAVDGPTSTTASADHQQRLDDVERLVADLEVFTGEGGALARVARRLENARTIEARTVAAWRARWERARKSLRERDGFAGLDLAPQVGLVPLGADPASGLQEFLHLESHSGPIPARDAAGRLDLGDEAGVVLVLIPGGSFWMGAQADDPAARNYDEFAKEPEVPVHEVELAPFLIAKHEMTQAQWRTLTGTTPSLHDADVEGASGLRRPVEQVTWFECGETLARFGMLIPTEAQWEYACRAGIAAPWPTGTDRKALHGSANLADETRNRLGSPSWKKEPGLDDGYAGHAPVGSFAPNRWGLHDVIGNVQEWCRDRSGSYRHPVEPGDGFRPVEDSLYRVYRGGGFYNTAFGARSAIRIWVDPAVRSGSLGLRPAAALRGR